MTSEVVAGLFGVGCTLLGIALGYKLSEHQASSAEKKRAERVVDALDTELRILLNHAELLIASYEPALEKAEGNPMFNVDCPSGMRLPDVVWRAHAAELLLVVHHELHIRMFCTYENAAAAERTLALLAQPVLPGRFNFEQVVNIRSLLDWLRRTHVNARGLLEALGRDVSMFRSDIKRPTGDLNAPARTESRSPAPAPQERKP